MDGILGRKLGMTQIFAEDGTAISVTVIQAGPCLVVQRKTAGTDGYEAIQIGLVEEKPAKVNKPTAGHFGKAGVAPVRRIEEFEISAGDGDVKAGDEIKATIFTEKEWVDVVGTSKGKGFQGVMKRVFPGMRGTGRMGGERVTVKNLQVVKVDAERNLIYVRGAVPGPRSGYLAIRRAKRG
jgi:large subunit ribosomal protein L3